mmetsp:Transcript_38669/g.87880  ORF Transcript_38669/g.87880 Transcript_38669/m.87880 type:complete len:208 (+) Transcript_38669:348-971(+)
MVKLWWLFFRERLAADLEVKNSSCSRSRRFSTACFSSCSPIHAFSCIRSNVGSGAVMGRPLTSADVSAPLSPPCAVPARAKAPGRAETPLSCAVSRSSFCRSFFFVAPSSTFSAVFSRSSSRLSASTSEDSAPRVSSACRLRSFPNLSSCVSWPTDRCSRFLCLVSSVITVASAGGSAFSPSGRWPSCRARSSRARTYSITLGHEGS